MSRAIGSLLVSLLVMLAGCAPTIKSTAAGSPSEIQLAQFWEPSDNIAQQDLYLGPWGDRYAPQPGQTYEILDKKTQGFSPGFDVKDESGREWSVKQGAEAGVEVVMSRLLSALGYHQPPVYYVPRWTIRGGGVSPDQQGARFRPKDVGLKNLGEWSWQQNPFVGTDAYGGLLAFLMLMNATDLKNSNNTLYEVHEPPGESSASRWYVVRDLGAALGETGVFSPKRGDAVAFARTLFITDVKGDSVQFDYRGRHKELIRQITVQDVRWMANLASQLTGEQWRDAFRAGGYGPEISASFIQEIQKRIEKARSI